MQSVGVFIYPTCAPTRAQTACDEARPRCVVFVVLHILLAIRLGCLSLGPGTDKLGCGFIGAHESLIAQLSK